MKLDSKEWMPYMDKMKMLGHLTIKGELPNRDYFLHDPSWYKIDEMGDIELMSVEDIIEHMGTMEAAYIVRSLKDQMEILEKAIYAKIAAQEEDKPF